MLIDSALRGLSSIVGRKRTNVAWNENLHWMNRTKCNNKKKRKQDVFLCKQSVIQLCPSLKSMKKLNWQFSAKWMQLQWGHFETSVVSGDMSCSERYKFLFLLKTKTIFIGHTRSVYTLKFPFPWPWNFRKKKVVDLSSAKR